MKTMETAGSSRNGREGDEKRHEGVIAEIASRKGLRLEDVKPLYDRVLSKMERDARIRDFLAVFAARKVEKFLDRKGTLSQRVLLRGNKAA
jgi:hypothetical protein